MRPFFAALAAASVLSTGCGYVGGVLPPLTNVPLPVSTITAVQRGPLLIAHFAVPTKTVEGLSIKGALTLDLRAGVGPAPWNEAQWAETASKYSPVSVENNLATYQIPVAPWIGKTIVLAARVLGDNGKATKWSAPVAVPVVAPLQQPQGVTATPQPDGIRIAWRGAGEHFRVLRKEDGAEEFVEAGSAAVPEYLDKGASFGKSYTYLVQAFTDFGDHKEAQSDLSEPTKPVVYKDVFAPAAPAGLRVTASPGSIELSWDANSEPDLAGYRVYRSINGGAFEKIADVNEIPTYSDHTVERGTTYRYAVSAVDKSGNESARSAPVEAALQ
jgi:hypothetical protein